MKTNTSRPSIFSTTILFLTILCVASHATAATAAVANKATSTAPTAAEVPLAPIPFDAQYELSLNGSSELKGSRVLTQTGDNKYTLVYKAEHMLFKVKESSTFKWINNQLIPLYYNSERSHLFGSRKKDVTFDWPNNVANFTYKKNKGHFTLEPTAVDPLSTLFVISTKIQQGLTSIDIRETDDNDIETKTYVVDGPETLDTAIGSLQTIKASLHRKESTQVWLAVDLNYLAVKVRRESKNGDIYELNISKYDGPRIERDLPLNPPMKAPDTTIKADS